MSEMGSAQGPQVCSRHRAYRCEGHFWSRWDCRGAWGLVVSYLYKVLNRRKATDSSINSSYCYSVICSIKGKNTLVLEAKGGINQSVCLL